MKRVLQLIVIACLGLLPALPNDAVAQEKRSGSILEFFGIRPAKPKAPPKKPKPDKKPSLKALGNKQKQTKRKTSAPASAVVRKSPVVGSETATAENSGDVSKAVDARKVLVVGDFMAEGVAEGLDAAFESDRTVAVTTRADGSSGFVRADHFDWPASITAILSQERPQVLVVMLGTNDRQPIQIDATSEKALSQKWSQEYRARAMAFATSIRASGVPVVWIGMPPFRQASMNADMSGLNEIIRSIAATTGGRFVDVWDGFLDEQGNFSINGIDHNGQPARLRASDGINLTSAGKRKIAFYAEKPIREALGVNIASGLRPSIGLGFDPFMLPGPQRQAKAALANITRLQPVSLFDPAFDGADELLGMTGSPVPETQSGLPATNLYVNGLPPAAASGRIDEILQSGPTIR